MSRGRGGGVHWCSTKRAYLLHLLPVLSVLVKAVGKLGNIVAKTLFPVDVFTFVMFRTVGKLYGKHFLRNISSHESLSIVYVCIIVFKHCFNMPNLMETFENMWENWETLLPQ